PSWVGDMVMAQSLFRCLAAEHPGVVIDVLAPEWCRPLLARMPEVRLALAMPIGHGELALGKRRRLGHELRAQAYDQAIVLPNSFKSALVPLFARIPLRTGWRGEMRGWLLNDCRDLDKKRYPLMVQRFAALAYAPGHNPPDPLPAPRLRQDTEQARALRERFGLGASHGVVGLCPGAEFGPAKQWPARHYAALAQAMVDGGRQVGLLGWARGAPGAQALVGHVADADGPNCHKQ